MKPIFATLTACALTLTFAMNAPAQTYGPAYGGVPSGYTQPYYQPGYAPNVYVQPQVGGSFGLSTPSFGLGINVGPAYVPNVAVYPRPVVVPSYYPVGPIVPFRGAYYPHYYHHYGHR